MTLAEITVLDGAAAGRVLRTEARARIGGDPACEVVLTDPGIAPVHAVIEPSGEGYLLRSGPGVRVKGAPARVASLSTFALLDVGPVTLLFQMLGGGYISNPTVHEPAPNLPPRRAEAAVHRIAKLSRARSAPAVALLDEDRVLVAGGEPPMRGGDEFANADIVSIAARTTREIPLRVARVEARATRLLDGRVVIAGGRTETAEILDPRTLTTTPAASMSVSRAGAAALLVAGDRVLLLGGQNEKSPHVAELYDAARDVWTSIPGPPLSRVVAAELDATRFLIANDRGFFAPLPPTTYFVLDTATFTFHPLSPPARPRRCPLLVSLGDGRALVLSGSPFVGPGVVREVDIFDLSTGGFTPTGDLRAPRKFPLAVVVGDRVLVIGGDSAMTGVYSAEVLDVARGTWSGLPAIREGMNPTGALSLGETAVVVGYEHVALARGEPWPLLPRYPSPGPRTATHAGITFRSAVAWGPRGQEHADVFCSRPGGAAVVALFRGSAGYCGDVGADVCRWALAELLAEPAYGAPLPAVTATPPLDVRSHHCLWTSYLLDRAPLPADPSALPEALAARIDAVLGAMTAADRRFDATAGGILACVWPGRMRVVRRGSARVYLVRDGQASLVVPEHDFMQVMIDEGKLSQDMLDEGIPDEVRAMWANMTASWFGRIEKVPPAFDLAVQPGDRLVFLTHAVLKGASDAELSAAVVDPSFAALTAGAEQEERGYGVVSVTASG